jgi:hypothetical protein
MSVTESGIRSDFLNPANYKATLEFAARETRTTSNFAELSRNTMLICMQ